MYVRKTEAPSLALKDYQTRYVAACIPDENNDYDQEIYYGTGIPIAEHPLKGSIPMRGCGHCESEKVKVIYAQWSVSVHSGDVYWDYEIVCDVCKKYTTRSYAEND